MYYYPKRKKSSSQIRREQRKERELFFTISSKVESMIGESPNPEDFGIKRETIESIKKEYETKKSSKTNSYIRFIKFILISLFCFYIGEKNPTVALGILIINIFLFLVVGDYKIEISTPESYLIKNIPQYERYLDERKKYNEKFNVKYEEIKLKTLSYWESLDGYQFEDQVAKIFSDSGIICSKTKKTGDRGIDLYLLINGKSFAVQCKTHKNTISPSVIRDMFGSMVSAKAMGAIVVSRTGFTQGCFDFIIDKPIILLDVNDLCTEPQKLDTKTGVFIKLLQSYSAYSNCTQIQPVSDILMMSECVYSCRHH